jgi:hypothetical protein
MPEFTTKNMSKNIMYSYLTENGCKMAAKTERRSVFKNNAAVHEMADLIKFLIS